MSENPVILRVIMIFKQKTCINFLATKYISVNATKNNVFYDLKFYSETRKNINKKLVAVSLPEVLNLCMYVRSRNSEATFQSNKV
jgi:hypothetical protein